MRSGRSLFGLVLVFIAEMSARPGDNVLPIGAPFAISLRCPSESVRFGSRTAAESPSYAPENTGGLLPVFLFNRFVGLRNFR